MINKKTKFCKAAALLGAAVMMISALAGCGKNTKVVLTAGSEKERGIPDFECVLCAAGGDGISDEHAESV